MNGEERIRTPEATFEPGTPSRLAGRRSRSRGCRASAAVVVTALLFSGCSDDDTDENAMTPDETNDVLASLAFASADDDARHRCLIETLGAEAERAELTNVPPFDGGDSVTKSWCNDAQANGSACVRGFLDSLTEPGVRALSVFAERDDAGATVDDYGYRAVRYPQGENAGSAEEPAWSLYYERRSGTQDGFTARFVPHFGDGGEQSRQFSLFQLFGYRDADISVRFEDELAPDALLSSLTESPERLESVLLERYDALLVEFERQAEDPASGLDESERQEAIAGAREHFGNQRDLVERNAETFHALLQEQVALDNCR